MNGMRPALLTNVTDDSRTMLSSGFAKGRQASPQGSHHGGVGHLAALPLRLYAHRFSTYTGGRPGT